MLNAHAEVIARLNREMRREIGIPLTWYEVLLILYESPTESRRMHELAEARVLSRSAATRLVDRLVDAGLVLREEAMVDGRGTNVVMTGEGRSLLRNAGRIHLDGIARYFGEYVSTEEASVVADVMWRVAEKVRSTEGE